LPARDGAAMMATPERIPPPWHARQRSAVALNAMSTPDDRLALERDTPA
jgi:hypothetical protein